MRTNEHGMCPTADDCRALIQAVRSQPDDRVHGNAVRTSCRQTTFLIVERPEFGDFTVWPLGSRRVPTAYRIVGRIEPTHRQESPFEARAR